MVLLLSQLRQTHADLGAPLNRMERAVARLRELNQLLAEHERDVARHAPNVPSPAPPPSNDPPRAP